MSRLEAFVAAGDLYSELRAYKEMAMALAWLVLHSPEHQIVIPAGADEELEGWQMDGKRTDGAVTLTLVREKQEAPDGDPED